MSEDTRQEKSIISIPEISQFSCEGCIKYSHDTDCECDCKDGEIFVSEDYEEEKPICGHCAGSGEGQYDGTRCTYCKGTGEERTGEDERDRYDEVIDKDDRKNNR